MKTAPPRQPMFVHKPPRWKRVGYRIATNCFLVVIFIGSLVSLVLKLGSTSSDATEPRGSDD